jgi:hypothetical protein
VGVSLEWGPESGRLKGDLVETSVSLGADEVEEAKYVVTTGWVVAIVGAGVDANSRSGSGAYIGPDVVDW